MDRSLFRFVRDHACDRQTDGQNSLNLNLGNEKGWEKAASKRGEQKFIWNTWLGTPTPHLSLTEYILCLHYATVNQLHCQLVTNFVVVEQKKPTNERCQCQAVL